MDYLEFLSNKRFVLESSGFDIDKSDLNPKMYDFQKDITRWALKKRKSVCICRLWTWKMPRQRNKNTNA